VVTRYVNLNQNAEPGDTSTAGRWKVSAKIQQLLNTLKRPKRRPLPEFYEDNDIELELAANAKDPNAPRPEGATMTPVQGEQLVITSGLPRSLEAALQRYGTSSFKAPMATVLDPNGKLTTTLTYGKLLSRAQKIAHALTIKVFSKAAGLDQVSCARDALPLEVVLKASLFLGSTKAWRSSRFGLSKCRSSQLHNCLVRLHVPRTRTNPNRTSAEYK